MPKPPEFQAVYRQHRPMVERCIPWLVAGGDRRPRFRGTALNDLWPHHRLAGLNPRRALTLEADPRRRRLGAGLTPNSP